LDAETEDQHLWHRASGYFIPREFVQTYYGGSKKSCFTRTEDCRRSIRAQWPHTGSRQRCLGAHSDSPRSSGCGDFNSVSLRQDQGPPTAMPRDFEISQGHPLSVREERQPCSADYSMYSTFLTASPGSVLFSRSTLLKKGSLLLVSQVRPYKAS